MMEWDVEKVKKRKGEVYDEIASFILPEKIERFNDLMAQYLILEWYTGAYNQRDDEMMRGIEKIFWREKRLRK